MAGKFCVSLTCAKDNTDKADGGLRGRQRGARVGEGDDGVS